MTTLTAPQYPFDPTGVAASNRIAGEIQPLMGPGNSDYYLVIPAAAPFFADTLQLSFKSLQGDIRPFVLGVDYYPSHYFLGASRACAKPIYGSITILNASLRGTLIFNAYQTLGGNWTLDTASITAILANLLYDPRVATWDQVAGYPDIFPPIPHEWNLQDMVGMSEVADKLDNLADAILSKASSDMVLHMNDKASNPHGVTCSMIGAATMVQVNAAIENSMNSFVRNTDDLDEGDTNQFFTQARVLSTVLTGLGVGQAQPLDSADNVLSAFMKLQALLDAANSNLSKKANMTRPQFTGLGSQNLVKINMTSTISIDITLAEAFQVTIAGNGAIGFNTNNLGDMTNQVIEFAVTTINDNSGNAYAISWPANVKWVDGTPPPRTTSPGAKDYWYFVSEDGGATFTGSLSNDNPR